MHFARLLYLAVVALTFGTLTAPAHADLTVPTAVVDLGEILGGRRLTQRFELENTGTMALEITSVERGCGCLAPRLEQRTLPPGGKTTLHIELRTLGQADGPHTWNAEVRYRFGMETKTLPLTLRGTVRNEVAVQPALLAIYTEKSARQEITLTDTRPTPLRVLSAETHSPALKVAEIIREGKTTRLVLVVSVESLPVGKHEGMVTIVTDDRDYEELQVPVNVTKSNRVAVQVVPERPTLRLTPGATTASTLVRLRSTAGQPVRVAKVESHDAALTTTWAAGPGDDATLKIQVQAPISRTSGELRVTLESRETLTVPFEIDRE